MRDTQIQILCICSVIRTFPDQWCIYYILLDFKGWPGLLMSAHAYKTSNTGTNQRLGVGEGLRWSFLKCKWNTYIDCHCPIWISKALQLVCVLCTSHLYPLHPTGDQKVAGSNPPGRQQSLVDIDINMFYGHSLPSSDSRRTVVSFWQKNVHNTG